MQAAEIKRKEEQRKQDAKHEAETAQKERELLATQCVSLVALVSHL